MGDALPAVQLGTGHRAVTVSAGLGATCAILGKTGGPQVLGRNPYGGLGLGDNRPRGDERPDMGDASPSLARAGAHRSAGVRGVPQHLRGSRRRRGQMLGRRDRGSTWDRSALEYPASPAWSHTGHRARETTRSRHRPVRPDPDPDLAQRPRKTTGNPRSRCDATGRTVGRGPGHSLEPRHHSIHPRRGWTPFVHAIGECAPATPFYSRM